MKKFELNKKYGNEFTIEIVKRTEKFVTIKSSFGESRVKLRDYNQGQSECISFKCWLIDSFEQYDEEEAKRISYENAYYR